MHAILVCGSRDWSAPDPISNFLKTFVGRQSVLIQGACRGADAMAANLAMDQNYSVICVPANWDKHGKAAGPIRNEAMLNLLLSFKGCGYEIRAAAFHLGGRGTQNMIDLLHGAEVPTTVFGG